MLEPLGVDLVELSGGSYESPAMTGRPADERTQAREAYFLGLAADLVKPSPLPQMLTGGITRRETAEKVLDSGAALVGVGTALSVTPDLPDRWRAGRDADRWTGPTRPSPRPPRWPRSATRCATWPTARPPSGTHPAHALLCEQRRQRRALRRYRTWLTTSRQAGATTNRAA
jgi:hypothetical protein